MNLSMKCVSVICYNQWNATLLFAESGTQTKCVQFPLFYPRRRPVAATLCLGWSLPLLLRADHSTYQKTDANTKNHYFLLVWSRISETEKPNIACSCLIRTHHSHTTPTHQHCVHSTLLRLVERVSFRCVKGAGETAVHVLHLGFLHSEREKNIVSDDGYMRNTKYESVQCKILT